MVSSESIGNVVVKKSSRPNFITFWELIFSGWETDNIIRFWVGYEPPLMGRGLKYLKIIN